MDAYSVSYTSPDNRSTSRIYQDLESCRVQSLFGTGRNKLLLRSLTMDSLLRRKQSESGPRPHVAIIGAGLAGLRCADILIQHGLLVTIIEGRERLGGRMFQETLPNGHTVDLGPNWIHGTDDNPINDLAKETGTAVGSWDKRSYVFDEGGNLFNVDESEVYSSIMWDIVQDAFQHSNKNSVDIHPDESLWDFFQHKVVEKVPDTEEGYAKKRTTILQIAELWGAFSGSPIETQSLKFFWLEECIDGENLFCAGTYEKIFERIAEPVRHNADIKYDTQVTKVELKTAEREKPRVHTNTGETLEFDEVVMTAPLGWLKKNLHAFEPPLPERIERGIQAIGYGCLEKVYISFPKAFWLEPDTEGRVVQGFCQWLAPNYTPKTNPKRWNQEIVDLASLGEHSHPTLLFYIFGEESQYITEEVSKLKTIPERNYFLYDFFQPYYSRLPHYDETSPDCKPTGCLSTDWMRDDLAGNGSYSNFPVGLTEGDKDIEAMRDGVPEGGLWLAGEHTAPFVALGTATGPTGAVRVSV
ncbi:putative polyketide synthase 1 [Colletotrichum spaethianum]|uniref:Polyketide synthase 1 n=1 Tax=Colletotrichum spaethianum TaxID=700344 RepID=A0AA37LAK8_9PEZI|nr:putative polyketide synthase 1 [Colletotrichum spaethianum]GKT44912.1 putative polyketide synthase 1 [Colletotrichum spaethianum]